MEPADATLTQQRLRRLIAPYQTLHDLLWSQLLCKQGSKGWLLTARQLFFSMKCTSPLLELMAREALRYGNAGDLVEWASTHADEEREHAEWFLEDLATAGVEVKRIRDAIPEDEILRLIGSQYALVVTVHPAAALGYFHAMETHPSDPARVRALAQHLALPMSAFRTILYHTEADQEHLKPIRALVEQYGADERLFQAMIVSGITCVREWAELFVRYAADDT